MTIDYSEVAQVIFARIPGSEEKYRDYAASWGGALGDVLVYPLVEDVIRDMATNDEKIDSAERISSIDSILACFSDLYDFGTKDVRDLVEIAFRPLLETMIANRTAIRRDLSPGLRRLFEKTLDFRKDSSIPDPKLH